MTQTENTFSIKLIEMLILRDVPEHEVAQIIMYSKPKLQKWIEGEKLSKSLLNELYTGSTSDVSVLLSLYKQLKTHTAKWIQKHKPDAKYAYHFI